VLALNFVVAMAVSPVWEDRQKSARLGGYCREEVGTPKCAMRVLQRDF
jgi:hypothetical protein